MFPHRTMEASASSGATNSAALPQSIVIEAAVAAVAAAASAEATTALPAVEAAVGNAANRKRKRAEPVMVAPRRGRPSVSKEAVQVELAELKEGMAQLTAARPRYLSADLQRLIVHVHMHELQERAQGRQKHNKRARGASTGGSKVSALDATAVRCGVGRATVARVWREYVAGKLLQGYSGGGGPGGTVSKLLNSRIRDSQEVVSKVRAYILSRRRDGLQCTGVDLTRFFVEEGELGAVDTSNSKEFGSAHRCVLRWLEAHGWQRGRDHTSERLQETIALRARRASYLAAVARNRRAPASERLREAFVDMMPVIGRTRRSGGGGGAGGGGASGGADRKKSGSRGGGPHFLLGCVVGPDLSKPADARVARFADLGGWFAPAYQACGPSAAKMGGLPRLDSAVHDHWFEGVCKALKEKGLKCLIVVEDAPRHHNSHLPMLHSLSKADLLQVLKREASALGVDASFWDRFSTKVELEDYLQKLRPLMKPPVYSIAAKYGHQLVFAPAFHKDLLPVSRVLSMVETNVADIINRGSVEDALSYCHTAFQSLNVLAVHEMYQQCLQSEQQARLMVDEDEARATVESLRLADSVFHPSAPGFEC